MADIYLREGDLDVVNGDIAVVINHDEILQFAVHAIATIYGEMVFHPTVGNHVYERRLKVLESDANVIMQDCINAIMADDRVSEVTYMEVSYEERDKVNVFVKFTLRAIDGVLISSMASISLQDNKAVM